MKRSQLIAHLAGKLNASAPLAPFAPVLAFDPLVSEDTVNASIKSKLSTVGVCIVVDDPGAATFSKEGFGAGPVDYTGEYLVHVAENPKGTHTLRGVNLTDAVESALLSYAREAAVTRIEMATTEDDTGAVVYLYAVTLKTKLTQ